MNIKVKVFIPAFLKHEALDSDGIVTLKTGAALADLYREIKMPLPLRFSFLYSINYEQARWDSKLQDGDIVTFFFPISGG